MAEFDCKFENRLCCHGIANCVIEFAQIVLYVRGQVPTLVPNILQRKEFNDSFSNTGAPNQRSMIEKRTTDEILFCSKFTKLSLNLREIFRTSTSDGIRRVALLLGNCPSDPKDIYFLNFDPIQKNPFCGNNGDFSAADKKKMCKSILLGDFLQTFTPRKNLHKNTKLFLCLYADRNSGQNMKRWNFCPRVDLKVLDKKIDFLTSKMKVNVLTWFLNEKSSVDRHSNGNFAEIGENFDRLKISQDNPCESDFIWYLNEEHVPALIV